MRIVNITSGLFNSVAIVGSVMYFATSAETEHTITGSNASFAEVSCSAQGFEIGAPIVRNPECGEGQSWISVFGTGGKGFDISHFENRESLKDLASSLSYEGLEGEVQVTYTDTIWNFVLDQITDFPSDYKTPGPFYTVPDEISFTPE